MSSVKKKLKNETPRSSERIKSRKSKIFQMPDRDDIFDKIDTTVSPEKTHDHLKPRKLVNNFTRETHRYNYDPAYTDESSGDEDFIDDDDDDDQDQSSDSEPSENEKENHSDEGNGDGFHLRARNGGVLESDSEDSSTDGLNSSKLRQNSIIESDSGSSVHSIKKDILSEEIKASAVPVQGVSQMENGDSDDEIISPKPRAKLKKPKSAAKKRQIVGSSSESENEAPCKPKRRACLGSVDSSSSSEDGDFERLYSSNEELDERLPSERAVIMESRKQHRRNLLEELRAKRETSKVVKNPD